MTCRTLLVYLDNDPQCSLRVKMAIGLAQRLGAHLVGVAPTGLIDMSTSIEGASALADLAASQWDMLKLDAAQTAAAFEAQCRGAGLESFEAVCDAADRSASLNQRATFSDLVIVGQADPHEAGYRGALQVLERHVMTSPRPTLVCPYVGGQGSVGDRVLVAWDGSREASRALSDSIPALKMASVVKVACWAERGQPHDSDARARMDALHGWLLRHGIDAEMLLESTKENVFEAILSRAADWSSDLIVMGAYGHSRLSEMLMGGASRGILASMTVPVLLSR